MRRLPAHALIAALWATSIACAASADGPSADERCVLRVWYSPDRALSRTDLKLRTDEAERPELIGSWSGFSRPGIRQFDERQAPDGSRWWTVVLPLPPGQYLYGLLVGGSLLLDDIASQSAFGPDPRYLDSHPYEAEFTLATVPDCSVAPPAPLADPPSQLEDSVIYQIMIDRFRGPAGALPAPPTPAQRAGGTLDGVRQAIEAAYFQKLGVTTLWLSPVYKNPAGLFAGRDGHLSEAYHGYWPSEPRQVEPQIGDEAGLRALVAAAHAHGLRVIFDAVPNHVYQGHPYFLQHSRKVPAIADAANAEAQSWFNDGPTACVCGDPGCDWGPRVEDCWFTPFLPDLNWRHPAVLQTGVDDLIWWLASFDLDGMRIDAVPMMPRAATRRIAQATRQRAASIGRSLLLLGEDYTGPGDLGRLDIRSFLGRAHDGLDSAFDFPLMWAARRTIADELAGLDDLEREFVSSQAAWQGSGAVMAHILNNHDTPRFISEAAGNAGNDPWNDPPPQPTDEETYRKHILGLAWLLTLPGMPVLYYGDEIGLAGANDPDSRRTLPDVLAPGSGGPAGLSTLQQQVLTTTQRLGKLRACLPALRRGTRTVLTSAADYSVAWAALDDDAANPALVVLSRARSEKQIFVPHLPAGHYIDALSGHSLDVANDPAPLVLEPLSPAVYVPASSPCLAE